MILDAHGNPYHHKKPDPRRRMHTDVYALPAACKVPSNEYRKAMKLLQRSDVRETIAKGDRQRNDTVLRNSGLKAKTIYLDVLRPEDKAAKDNSRLLHKHQDALVDTIQKRAKENDFETCNS